MAGLQFKKEVICYLICYGIEIATWSSRSQELVSSLCLGTHSQKGHLCLQETFLEDNASVVSKRIHTGIERGIFFVEVTFLMI